MSRTWKGREGPPGRGRFQEVEAAGEVVAHVPVAEPVPFRFNLEDPTNMKCRVLETISLRSSKSTAFNDVSNTGNLSAHPGAFGIDHYTGACTYDVHGLVSTDVDLLDAALVALLWGSSVPFVAKLFTGPSLTAEPHMCDPDTIAELRRLDPAKTYPSMAQLDGILSAMLHGAKEGRTRMWTMTCIQPNDSGSANSFDKRCVRALRALLVPAMVQRVSSSDCVAEFDAEFCAWYVPTMRRSTEEWLEQCACAGGWREGTEYRMLVDYSVWKAVEDVLHAQEKAARGSGEERELADKPDADEGTEYMVVVKVGKPTTVQDWSRELAKRKKPCQQDRLPRKKCWDASRPSALLHI
ncbi:hypothetical protein C8R44DRAFT_728024 [Mycena epipterygia]|nr:hypothetical protein C8R44DRAFT_728024 [Mycena epipterygia]